MAQTILRRIWSHCQCSLKHNRAYSVGSSCGFKNDFPLQNMSTHMQLNIPYLLGNTVYGPPNYIHTSLNLFHKKDFSTCCVHSTRLQVLENLDLEEIKKQVLEEKKKHPDKQLHFTARIKEIVTQKCDEIVANFSPEDMKKLKVIQLEHSFMYSEGHLIPRSDEMTNEYWLEAMKLITKNQRLNYYNFLAKRLFTKMAAKEKQAAKKTQTPDDTERTPHYEHGRLVMRIYETTMKRWQNHRLASSMMFGIPLVLDMDYESHMRNQEIKNTASQLYDLYVINRSDDCPFHLHFTSCSQENGIFRSLQYLQQEEQAVLATVTENSFLDLFPKENLVYLSPNARQAVREFDPTAVYIIGAYNDKATMKPISYARAKEYNIKCQRLPLDEHLEWAVGSKSLTLNHMMHIMLGLKNKKSWKEALEVIPKRKLKVIKSDD